MRCVAVPGVGRHSHDVTSAAWQVKDMAAFLRDKIAFLDDAVRSQGVPAEHVLDAYVDTVASEEHHEVLARRLWPRVLDKIRKDTRVQRKQTLLHGRQVAHLYVCVCVRALCVVRLHVRIRSHRCVP